MTKSAHAQCDYKLRKLPQCSRCNNEFSLVVISYENLGKPIYEWECSKCHKTVPRERLREEDLQPDYIWLKEWLKEANIKNKRI